MALGLGVQLAPMGRALTRRFFARPVEVVARALLGKKLVVGGRSGVIVETEAYLGPDDRASHARFGRTDRNAVMFGPAGHSYVYLCYGIHELFNIVTGRDGEPQAVLIRALAPSRCEGDLRQMAGPGKLTRALGIDRSHSGLDLTRGDPIAVQPGRRVDPGDVVIGPRIGVDYAGEWARAPLRFWLRGDPAVSGPKAAR